jgi:hypothetical protein
MRIVWLARLLLPRLKRLAESRPPNFEVTRDGGRDVYLRRWWIIPRNNHFNVYLHNMLKDDDDILHDHMYWSLSLVLTDGIEERYTLDPERTYNLPQHGEDDPNWHRTIREGQLVLRSPCMAHQLIVHKPAWTLFITGPRVKEWGFWCPKGFRHWKDYVALTQDPSQDQSKGTAGTSGRGVGCGEMS